MRGSLEEETEEEVEEEVKGEVGEEVEEVHLLSCGTCLSMSSEIDPSQFGSFHAFPGHFA